LVGQGIEHENVDDPEKQPDERQDQPEEKKLGEGILAAEAGHLQFRQGGFVGKRALEVQALDDASHPVRLFLAKALAAAFCVGRQPGALLGAKLVALERHSLHAGLQVAAAEGGNDREDGRENGHRHQQRDQEGRVEDRLGDLFGHAWPPWRSDVEVHHLLHHEDTDRHPDQRNAEDDMAGARDEERHDVVRGWRDRRGRRR
jgi:hypothetical protein